MFFDRVNELQGIKEKQTFAIFHRGQDIVKKRRWWDLIKVDVMWRESI
jgi:hypothetical protein